MKDDNTWNVYKKEEKQMLSHQQSVESQAVWLGGSSELTKFQGWKEPCKEAGLGLRKNLLETTQIMNGRQAPDLRLFDPVLFPLKCVALLTAY